MTLVILCPALLAKMKISAALSRGPLLVVQIHEVGRDPVGYYPLAEAEEPIDIFTRILSLQIVRILEAEMGPHPLR